jgi:hypothetical protein
MKTRDIDTGSLGIPADGVAGGTYWNATIAINNTLPSPIMDLSEALEAS